MRSSVRAFVQDAAETLPIASPLVEIGSRPASGQEEHAYLRAFFPGVDYIGCDMQEGPNVDRIEDIHKLTFAHSSVGTVLCCETLEHVHDPLRAVQEIHRVLKPVGVAIITSVMAFPIHEHPWDFWRFTPEGFALLLEPFETSLVFAHGFDLLPEGVFGVGVKGPFPGLTQERFPRVDAMVRGWGKDMPVDLGPVRLSLPQVWKLAMRTTVDEAMRRIRNGSSKRAAG